MKKTMRVLVGIVGVFAVVVGIKQIASGVRQMAGKPAPTRPQEVGEKVAVAAHGCSLRVPRGWTEKQTEQGGTMFVAPKESGYSANLQVFSEPSAQTLREYVDANISAVKGAAPDAKFVSDAPFAADSGSPGFKTAFSNKFKDLEVAQAMYFFDGPAGRKILITTTAPAIHGAELEPLFDACVKGLTVTPP